MSSVINGGQIVIFINGLVFGRATSFKWQSSTPHAPRMGLDSLTPYELSPVSARITGEVGVLRTHLDGGLEGAGIVAQFQDLPRERYFSILAVDRLTQTKVFQADYCKVVSQQWGVGARGLMEGSFAFEAVEWRNEVDRT